MTGGADFDLCGGRSHRIFGGMQRMARGAGDIARGMCARRPGMRRIGLMAAQALRILQRRGRLRLLAEIDHAREWSAAGLDVRAPRSVARFALQTAMTEGSMRIIGSRMLGAEDAGHAGIAMTSKTSIRSLGTVEGIR